MPQYLPSHRLSVFDAQNVDRVCTLFEIAWRDGQRPRIEDFVGDTVEPERTALLQELIALDVEYRRARGDACHEAEYLDRFRDLDPTWLSETVASSIPTASPSATGPMLGRYRLLETLGEGGFGIVFLADQRHPVRRQVALKVLKPGMDSQQILARFEAERQVLALLDHPNIARVLDGGTIEAASTFPEEMDQARLAVYHPALAPGRPYFVMDLVRGPPITEFCDQNRLGIGDRLQLFTLACQAVQHAHLKGIIHRDLKPSNLLVTRVEGVPVLKVIDFGIAKAIGQQLTEDTVVTGLSQMIGTPLYMSPEQADLNGQDVDTRCDIYALGVLLYELLTGTTPFDRQRLRGASYDEMRRILRSEEPPCPSVRVSALGATSRTVAQCRGCEPGRLRAILKGELDWIVMKALEKERERRYETASAFAADVQHHLHHEPVSAGPAGTNYRLRKFVRRNRGPVLIAALLLLVLVGGAIGTGIGLVQAEAAEQLAKQRLQDLVSQQELTQQQAAITQAVNDFLLTDLLGQADLANQPFRAEVAGRKRDITVRELLDRAARNIEGKFGRQPLTEAAIRLTLGDAYQQLGRYPDAKKQLERSVQLRTEQLGPDQPDTLVSKLALARLYGNQGEFQQARSLFQEIQLLAPAEQKEMICQAKSGQAIMYREEGQYGLADPLLKEVLTDRLLRLGPRNVLTLQSKFDLAHLYHSQKKLNLAEPLFKEVFETAPGQIGADHPLALAAMDALADVYTGQGKYGLAEPLLKAVAETCAVKLGPDDIGTLSVKHNLAELYYRQNKYGLAETLDREVLASLTASLPADHPKILQIKDGLAVLYRVEGKYPEAEQLLKEVIASQTVRLGVNHPQTLNSKNNLADVYQNQEKFTAAEVLYKEVIAGLSAKLGADNPDTLQSRNNLAWLYFNMQKYEQAEALYRDVIAKARKNPGLAHPNTQTHLRGLIACYEKMDKPALAEPLLRELAELSKEQDGPHSANYGGRLAALGYNLLLQKNGPAAEPVLVSCLAIRQQLEPDAWRTSYTNSMLGEALVLQKKYRQAEPYLIKGYQGLHQHEAEIPPPSKFVFRHTVELLIQASEAQGQTKQAAQWRQQLSALR